MGKKDTYHYAALIASLCMKSCFPCFCSLVLFFVFVSIFYYFIQMFYIYHDFLNVEDDNTIN
jgi:hypothetical protein